MYNKELIKRLINFDEDDTSTGFNAVSSQQTFEEYLYDNIDRLYYVTGPNQIHVPPREYIDYLRENLVPRYYERLKILVLTRFPDWKYRDNEWQLENGFPYYRLPGFGKYIIQAWNADFISELIRKYGVKIDCSDLKKHMWFRGTPENIGFVLKNVTLMEPNSGWTTTRNAAGEQVYDKYHVHPEVTVWTTGQPENTMFPEGISFAELYNKVPKLWVIETNPDGTEKGDLLVYPNSQRDDLVEELHKICERTGNG